MTPIKQTGAVLLLMMFIVMVGAMSAIVTQLNQKSSIIKRDIKSTTALNGAKEALIGWALTHTNTGQLPLPDTNNNAQGNCPATVVIADRIGRLPWLNYPPPCNNPRAGIGMDFKDQSGETLWYAVSVNLIEDGGAAPVIDSNMLLLTAGWISVFDGAGVLLSDRVAAVIIAPGKSLLGQNRANEININAYLEAINSTIDDQFMIAEQQENFNDRLIYITADELLNNSVKKVVEGRGGVW